MVTKYIERDFSEIAPGDVFLSNPNAQYPCMKIKPIIDTDDRRFTAVRLIDGEPMEFKDIDVVCPLNCFIARN